VACFNGSEVPAPTPAFEYDPAVSMAIPKLKVTENLTDVDGGHGEYVVPAAGS
jgi:hypothetical protein